MKIIEQKTSRTIRTWIAAGESTKITCELTLAELRALRLVIGRMGGLRENTLNKWLNPIYQQLRANQIVEDGCPPLMLREQLFVGGSPRFNSSIIDENY